MDSEANESTNNDAVSTIQPEASSSSSTKPTASTTSAIVDDPELDALLEDALQDFGKPLPEAKNIKKPGNPAAAANADDMNQAWSEEFIKEATAQFEKKMREYAARGATGAPSSSASPDSLQQIVDAATKAAVGDANPGLAACINDAMNNLTENPGLLDDEPGFNDEEIAKLLNSFSLGENADDAEIDQIMPFMTNMMQKLLSKELLQPVLADIVDRYPDWLADNREKLSTADFEKYNGQYDSMKRILEEYAKEKDSDTEDIKQQRFDRISELMLKVQYAGPPPKELVGDMEGATNAGLFADPSAAAGLGQGDCSVM